MSPRLVGATGVAAVLAAAGLMACSTPAGSSAHPPAARPASGQVVSARPPAGLQRAADQLVADGVPQQTLDVSWKGKSEPAVQTGDGVKEPLNRRATIDVQF